MQAFSMFKKTFSAVCAAVLLLSNTVQAQGELKGVTLTVYLDVTAPPISFISKDMRYPDGVDVEIIRELQRRLGFNLKDNRVFPLPTANAIELVKANKADMIGGAMSYTVERADMFRFSPIYYSTGMSIMFSQQHSADATGLSRLEGKLIAVKANSSAEEYVKKVLPSSRFVAVDNIVTSYFMLAKGEVDCVIFDRLPLIYFADTMKHLRLDVSEDIFNQADSQYAFGFPNDSPYAEIISDEILRMMYDGSLYKIIKKWEKR